jgi:hypothetical protein
MRRLTYNPDFDALATAILEFLAAQRRSSPPVPTLKPDPGALRSVQALSGRIIGPARRPAVVSEGPS